MHNNTNSFEIESKKHTVDENITLLKKSIPDFEVQRKERTPTLSTFITFLMISTRNYHLSTSAGFV